MAVRAERSNTEQLTCSARCRQPTLKDATVKALSQMLRDPYDVIEIIPTAPLNEKNKTFALIVTEKL